MWLVLFAACSSPTVVRFGYSSFTPVHAQLGAWLHAHPEAAAAHHLRLDLRAFASGKEQGDAVPELDAFFTCEVPAAEMLSRRDDLHVVATPGELGRVAVLAKKDHATTVAELAGRRVGFTPNSTTAMDWATWAGPLEVTNVAFPTNDLERVLMDGTVDAIVAWDPWVEDLLQRHPEVGVVATRDFRSVLAVSATWAQASGAGPDLVALLAEAQAGVAADRPTWDAAAATSSGWPLAVVTAVTDHNTMLAGRAPVDLHLQDVDRTGLARAFAYTHHRFDGVVAPELVLPR